MMTLMCINPLLKEAKAFATTLDSQSALQKSFQNLLCLAPEVKTGTRTVMVRIRKVMVPQTRPYHYHDAFSEAYLRAEKELLKALQ